MTETIQISEGLQFYFKNSEQQAAIDQIIYQKTIPNDLSWDDAEKFNHSKLSAQSVQIDYWKLLINIWEKTWAKVIDFGKYSEKAPQYYEKNYSLEYIWENYLYKAFDYNGTTFITCCYATRDNGVCLGFAILDKNDSFNLSTELLLSDVWLVEKGSEFERWTKTQIVSITGQEQINIDQLSLLAKEVVEKLEATV